MLKQTISLLTFLKIGLINNSVIAQESYQAKFEDLEINYVARIGGYCKQLVLAKKDITSVCQNYFTQMVLSNGRVIYMIPINEEKGLYINFSGGKDFQPRLERYTLLVDTERLMKGADMVSQVNVVGTCEMYGNPDRDETIHNCFVQDIDGGEIHFQFVSQPDKIKIIN
jgi:hypothetical protein